MEPMNLLLVERNADWSEWPSVSQLLGRAVLVLVQQADETRRAFHERITGRLARGKPHKLNRVVVLRDGDYATHDAHDLTSDALLRRLATRARYGLRFYPYLPVAKVAQS